MTIVNHTLKIPTEGAGDLVDLTKQVQEALRASGLKNGAMTVFVKGSTAAIKALEYEPGLVKDMREMAERIAPSNKPYHHDDTWADNNGFSHVRASLFGPSLVIPFIDYELFLGKWQQVVLAEFDIRNRHRDILIQIIGE